MEAAPRCPLVAAVTAAADGRGHTPAVVAGGESFTYGRLLERAGWWAGKLRRLDLEPGSVVCVVAGTDPDLPAAFLGVRSAGLVPALLDSRQSEERLVAALQAARPAAVVRCGPAGLEVPREEPRPALPVEAGYVAFSSGTQGPPKGIVGSAAGLAHFLRWESRFVGADPHLRTAMLTSPSFDVALRDLFLPLTTGGRLHVAPDRVRYSARQVLPWLAEQGIGLLHVVPSLGRRWAQASRLWTRELRWTLFAGEPLTLQHLGAWRRVAPQTRLVNLYGPSETTLAVFAHEVPCVRGGLPEPGDGSPLVPVGGPIPSVGFSLEATGTDAADGYRLSITSPYGSLGYLPGTVSAEEDRRLVRSDGWTTFHTQDRVRLDAQGDLVVLGRLDGRVKRHEVLLDVAAIEAACLALDVDAACCVQDPATSRVQLVCASRSGVPPAALLRRLRQELGPAAPDDVVVVDALPLLPSGKVDRSGVRGLVAERDQAVHGAFRSAVPTAGE